MNSFAVRNRDSTVFLSYSLNITSLVLSRHNTDWMGTLFRGPSRRQEDLCVLSGLFWCPHISCTSKLSFLKEQYMTSYLSQCLVSLLSGMACHTSRKTYWSSSTPFPSVPWYQKDSRPRWSRHSSHEIVYDLPGGQLPVVLPLNELHMRITSRTTLFGQVRQLQNTGMLMWPYHSC